MESHCYAPMSGTRRSSRPLSFSFLLSLSLSAAAPPSRSSEQDGENGRRKRQTERGKIRGETGTLIITLAFMYYELGRFPQTRRSFSSFRVHSLIFSTLLPFSLLPSSPLTLFHTARSFARAVSLFSFSFLFFFLALSSLLLMVGASDAFAYERARDEREHERTDGRTDTRACIPESRNEVHASERES